MMRMRGERGNGRKVTVIGKEGWVGGFVWGVTMYTTAPINNASASILNKTTWDKGEYIKWLDDILLLYLLFLFIKHVHFSSY